MRYATRLGRLSSMSSHAKPLDGIILMGPFGSGKSYLGNRLNVRGIAHYADLEGLIYQRFGNRDEFNLASATEFLRNHYHEHLSLPGLAAFESTGVVQRPLLLEVIDQYEIALVHVVTPKQICLDRVAKRNIASRNPIGHNKAAEFFEYWINEIAPTYQFSVEVDGTDEEAAVRAIEVLANH